MYYAIREHTPVAGLPSGLERVHLVRPISVKKLRAILHQCPQLNEIGVSPTVEKRLNDEAKDLLKKKGVTIVGAHRAGRAISINLETIQKIADLKKDFLSVRAIQEKTGIPKSTIHYLLKKAKRHKIKKGKNVIYVS